MEFYKFLMTAITVRPGIFPTVGTALQQEALSHSVSKDFSSHVEWSFNKQSRFIARWETLLFDRNEIQEEEENNVGASDGEGERK